MRGFTLAEVAIVVAIVAVLAAIAIPNFLKWGERTKAVRESGKAAYTVVGDMERRIDAELGIACYSTYSSTLSCVRLETTAERVSK